VDGVACHVDDDAKVADHYERLFDYNKQQAV
jgi:hypothetical protein